MVQVMAAIFKDGVFKPDQPPVLSDSARVRLVVETLGDDKENLKDESWLMLQFLWNASSLDSGGDRMTRDQLHERH